MRLEDHSDDELLQGLALDIRGTFQTFVEAYNSPLYQYVVSQVHDPQIAEEIMQDSWIRIYQALGQYSSEKIRSLHLRAWLFTIVRHEMCTHMGKKNRSNAISIENLDDTVKDDAQLPLEDIILLKSQVEEVRIAIEQLSPALRSVLQLHLFQELGYQEIADYLGESTGTIRTRAFRGMSLLRERLTTTIN